MSEVALYLTVGYAGLFAPDIRRKLEPFIPRKSPNAKCVMQVVFC